MCGLPCRSISGASQVFNGLTRIAAANVVVGQLADMALQLSCEQGFNRLGGALVQEAPALLSAEL
jgi:hypothetical protein